MLFYMNKPQIQGWAILATRVLMLMAVTLLAACSGKQETTKPIRKQLVQAIYASGKLYPMHYYRAVSLLPGYLQELYVEVGDTVQVGQPLFRVKNQQSDLAIGTAKNNLALAQDNLAANSPLMATLKNEVEAAYAKYVLDSTTLVRTQNLRANQAGTELQLDQAKTAASTSRDLWQKAAANLLATKRKLETDRQNALNAVRIAETNQGDYIVRSTVAGRVYDIIAKVGDLVGAQVPVMEVGAATEYEVELAVDESDANLVRSGQEVVFNAEFLGTETLKGRITRVYPKITQLNKSIKALASISLPDTVSIFAGSTIEANIIYSIKPKALVLPRFFVLKDTVLLKSGLGLERRKVQVGASDVEYVEILSGLTEADEVQKP